MLSGSALLALNALLVLAHSTQSRGTSSRSWLSLMCLQRHHRPPFGPCGFSTVLHTRHLQVIAVVWFAVHFDFIALVLLLAVRGPQLPGRVPERFDLAVVLAAQPFTSALAPFVLPARLLSFSVPNANDEQLLLAIDPFAGAFLVLFLAPSLLPSA